MIFHDAYTKYYRRVYTRYSRVLVLFYIHQSPAAVRRDTQLSCRDGHIIIMCCSSSKFNSCIIIPIGGRVLSRYRYAHPRITRVAYRNRRAVYYYLSVRARGGVSETIFEIVVKNSRIMALGLYSYVCNNTPRRVNVDN